MSTFNLYLPIAKVNKDQRTVGGWATTEKVDKQNEIVDYDASKTAFDNWHGNIREMHEAKAVGKAIDVQYDDDSKKIYVTAKISKGAEDTWEKVKDGTLTGFSIGGQTMDKVQQIVKDEDDTKQITRITKYRLNELSLVDNPANPEASFELVKSDREGHLTQTSIVEDSGSKKYKKYIGGDKNAMPMSKEVLGKLSTLLSHIDKIVKQDWEDPNAEVGDAKKTPEGSVDSHEDVSAGVSKDEGDWEDPNPEVSGAKDTPAGSTDSKEDVSAGVQKRRKRKTADEEMDDLDKADEEEEAEKADMDSDPDSSLRTQEDEDHGAAPVTKLYKQNEDGEYEEVSPKEAKKMLKAEEEDEYAEKADMHDDPDSNLRTQEEDPHGQANLATKAEDEEDDAEKAEEEEEKAPVKRYRRKRARKAADEEEDAEKAEEGDKEVAKSLRKTINRLTKRIDKLEKSPMPRKYLQKRDDAPSKAESLQKATDEVKAAVEESRRTGKPLSPAMEAKRDEILNKMIDNKFGADLRKV